jgi:hypothetical protein
VGTYYFLCVKSENTVLWRSKLLILTLDWSYCSVETLRVAFLQLCRDVLNHLKDTCSFITFAWCIVTWKQCLGSLHPFPVCVSGKGKRPFIDVSLLGKKGLRLIWDFLRLLLVSAWLGQCISSCVLLNYKYNVREEALHHTLILISYAFTGTLFDQQTSDIWKLQCGFIIVVSRHLDFSVCLQFFILLVDCSENGSIRPIVGLFVVVVDATNSTLRSPSRGADRSPAVQ